MLLLTYPLRAGGMGMIVFAAGSVVHGWWPASGASSRRTNTVQDAFASRGEEIRSDDSDEYRRR